jgi:hypothetical protein
VDEVGAPVESHLELCRDVVNVVRGTEYDTIGFYDPAQKRTVLVVLETLPGLVARRVALAEVDLHLRDVHEFRLGAGLADAFQGGIQQLQRVACLCLGA